MVGHTDRNHADIEVDNTQPWQRKCWGRITDSYRRHPYFRQLAPKLELIFKAKYQALIDINLRLIEFSRQELKINVPMVRSSTLNVQGSRSALLFSICKSLGADTYLSGPSGKLYLDQSLFSDGGVAVEYHEFSHPVYAAPVFKPYLSTLDLLMNYGPKSREILGLP